MKRIVLILGTLVLFLGTADAATRYVSKSGSDSNDGSSWAQAWLSIQKVNASLSGGDTCFFSTGIWNDTTLHAIAGGYATETVYACSAFAAANGDGQYHFARIFGGTPITSWTQRGTDNVWIATYTPKKTNPPLYQGRTNLILRVADSASVNSAGKYWNGNGRFVVWCYGNVNPNTVEIVAGERYNTETRRSGTHQSHIKFIGLSFEYSFGKGISCMQYGDEIQSDSIFIERCYFNQVAASGGTNTAHINFMSSGVSNDGADYVSVLACSLGNSYTWSGADDAATHTISGNNASSISMYINRYSTIDSCIFSSTSWSAQGTIDFKAGYGGGAWQEYDTIRNCIFTTNAQAAIWIYNHCRYVSFYGNIVNGPRNGVEFDYGGGEWSGNPGYNEIFNNTIIGNNQTGQANYSFYRAISNQGYGYTHAQYNNSIKYNVFYSELASTRASIDSIRFYDPALIDSNMYYSTGTIAFYSPYATNQTQSWWQTTSGLDVHSTFSTNPNLNNVGAGDYSRPSASGEMNRTYGYQTFTVFGAWQPEDEPITITDTCIQITGKTSLPLSDTCYCIVDSLLYTFEQRDTLIHTNGKDNIRIWGYHSDGGRAIIGYSISDTGSNSYVTDQQTGSVAIHVSGSDNVLIKNIAVVPRVIDDSVRSFVAVNALTVVGINIDNDSLVAGGFSSRAYQQSTTGGGRAFNQLLQNSYFGTVSKGYHRRDALYGATIKLVTSVLQSDRYGGIYEYAYKVRNNRIHTIHTGIGSAGLTVDSTVSPRDTVYPLIFIDSNNITLDTRNDLFVTYNVNDVNNSAGDPFGIGVDGVDKGSRIMGNTISSMASTYYGGDGILLQHIDATIDSPFVVAYNTMFLQHGPHPRIEEGRQAVVGTYIRNYSAGYYVSGLHYHHNTGYLVVDSHDSSTYRGKLYEGVRMGYDNGSRGNIIENNHFSVVASDSATRTTLDSLQGSGISFVQRDSLYTGREYTGRGTIVRNNYWRVPKTPFWFGDTRLGYGANNCVIDGDTANTIYPGDSTFARFHQSGTYFDHHWGNSIRNVTLQGYADAADVIKGTIGIADSTTIPYPSENRHRQGKQLELARTMNLLVVDESATPIADATVWAVNNYGNRIDFDNTSGGGTTNELLRWRFFGYDALPADGFAVEDSSGYNNFTIWAKSGSDSASVSWTLGAGRALTDTIAITTSAEPYIESPMKQVKGINLKGVIIK